MKVPEGLTVKEMLVDDVSPDQPDRLVPGKSVEEVLSDLRKLLLMDAITGKYPYIGHMVFVGSDDKKYRVVLRPSIVECK